MWTLCLHILEKRGRERQRFSEIFGEVLICHHSLPVLRSFLDWNSFGVMTGTRVVTFLVITYLTGIQGQAETTTEAPSKYLNDFSWIHMWTMLFFRMLEPIDWSIRNLYFWQFPWWLCHWHWLYLEYHSCWRQKGQAYFSSIQCKILFQNCILCH